MVLVLLAVPIVVVVPFFVVFSAFSFVLVDLAVLPVSAFFFLLLLGYIFGLAVIDYSWVSGYLFLDLLVSFPVLLTLYI